MHLPYKSATVFLHLVPPLMSDQNRQPKNDPSQPDEVKIDNNDSVIILMTKTQ